MESVLSKISDFFRSDFPISAGESLVLAVSGGPDSVFMLDALYNAFAGTKPVKLVVAHYNHCQRKDADEDEEFVRALARQYGVDFVSDRLSGQLPQGIGLEAALREKRYEFLRRVAVDYKAKAISLAHNKDDQAETVLLNFLRGTGMQGLRGMERVSSMGGDIAIIRPILDISRNEIEAYLSERAIDYRIDSTNFSLDFTRNRIRHELIPLLEREYNPKIKERLVTLANIIAQDFNFIYNVSSQVFQSLLLFTRDGELFLGRQAIESLQESILRQVFRMAILRIKGSLNKIDFRHYQEFVKMINDWPLGSILDLPGCVSVEKRKKGYRFFRRGEVDEGS